MDLNFARLFREPFIGPFTDCLHSLQKIYYLKLDFIKIQKRGNITDILLKTMDDFAFQVNSNLGYSTNKSELLSRNIALRVDRWNPKHEASQRSMLNLFRLL